MTVRLLIALGALCVVVGCSRNEGVTALSAAAAAAPRVATEVIGSTGSDNFVDLRYDDIQTIDHKTFPKAFAVKRDPKLDALVPAGWSTMGEISGVNQKMDIVFVVDITGSMYQVIDGIKRDIERFASDLTGNGIDASFGIVAFEDWFTTSTAGLDAQQLKLTLAQVWPANGNDPNEASLLATAEAFRLLQEQGGKPGHESSVKVIVLVTDNPGHDGNGMQFARNCDTSLLSDMLRGSGVLFYYQVSTAAEGTGGVMTCDYFATAGEQLSRLQADSGLQGGAIGNASSLLSELGPLVIGAPQRTDVSCVAAKASVKKSDGRELRWSWRDSLPQVGKVLASGNALMLKEMFDPKVLVEHDHQQVHIDMTYCCADGKPEEASFATCTKEVDRKIDFTLDLVRK